MERCLYHIHLIFSRLAEFFSSQKHLHTARFAKLHELIPISTDKLAGTQILIGKSSFNRVFVVKPTKKHREIGNILIDGMTRAGKGLAVESNLLNWPRSAIVNDIKKELYLRTAGYREKGLNGKSYLFDPRGNGHRFDPLEGLTTDSDLRLAANTLLHRSNEGQNAVFTERAITMLTQIFIAAKLEKQRALPFTYKILNEGLYGVATILEIISQRYNYYPNLATKFLDISHEKAKFDSKFLQDCYSTMTARMNNILTKESVRCFSGSDFTAKDIITSEKPITVYLHWPERDLRLLAPLIHLIWSSLFDGMIEAYDSGQGRGCHRVLAVLDEIFRTGFPELPKYATTVCGRDISLLVTTQCKSQMDAEYGVYKGRILKAQFKTQLRYCPSDKETAKDIEEDLDYTSGFAHSKTEHEGSTSNGENEQKIPLMSAHEIRLMDTEEIIGFRAGMGLHPFRAKRFDWRDFPELVKRANMEPPKTPILSAIPMNEKKFTHNGFHKSEPIQLFSSASI